MIGLSAMRGVRVDPIARVARVDGGATWGDVDRATQARRLHVGLPTGTVGCMSDKDMRMAGQDH